MIFRRLLAAFVGSLAALTQTAFIASWPPPLGEWSLTLLLLTALISAFRFDLAIALAIGAGLTFDLLHTTPPIIFLSVWLASAALLHLLFTRVLTNVSLVSFIALNGAGFLLLSGLTTLAWLALDTLSGIGGAVNNPPLTFVVSIILHCTFATVIMLMGRVVRDRMARRFYMPRYGR